ncbi:hypothetical protein [Streptomyces sp. NBC_00199]|uniref:hypothetical protein n=1 Tax=Streptomyces sp. NBC_00199 TaxID=2975678 RepID=UPI002256D70A|nr:hypothetical protein [Streptomyces sp. NBC_00199]MCX5263083.1 hypothetical protein [Streptomyces sp. NBC_00199]
MRSARRTGVCLPQSGGDAREADVRATAGGAVADGPDAGGSDAEAGTVVTASTSAAVDVAVAVHG